MNPLMILGGEDFTFMPSMPYVTFIGGDNLMQREIQFTINFLDDMIIEGNQTFSVSILGTNSTIEFTVLDESSKWIRGREGRESERERVRSKRERKRERERERERERVGKYKYIA